VIPVLHVEYVVIHVFQLRNTAYASMGMLSEVLSDDIHIIMCLYSSRFNIAVYILLILKLVPLGCVHPLHEWISCRFGDGESSFRFGVGQGKGIVGKTMSGKKCFF